MALERDLLLAQATSHFLCSFRSLHSRIHFQTWFLLQGGGQEHLQVLTGQSCLPAQPLLTPSSVGPTCARSSCPTEAAGLVAHWDMAPALQPPTACASLQPCVLLLHPFFYTLGEHRGSALPAPQAGNSWLPSSHIIWQPHQASHVLCGTQACL